MNSMAELKLVAPGKPHKAMMVCKPALNRGACGYTAFVPHEHFAMYEQEAKENAERAIRDTGPDKRPDEPKRSGGSWLGFGE
ncbi:hypothetical protein [Oceanibaculum indicum]|nr:hypothetical protein [Oceanibaculum indicum]